MRKILKRDKETFIFLVTEQLQKPTDETSVFGKRQSSSEVIFMQKVYNEKEEEVDHEYGLRPFSENYETFNRRTAN